MPFEIVRNDITRMKVDAIVNTANPKPKYSSGTDTAVYKAAGEEELLAERKKIGHMNEGDVAITPGFNLPAKYIIHAVSPFYMGGDQGEEEKLRSCYRKSLQLAKENGIKSISFPLISTGGFGYPKEEGMRIAVDEINAFLLGNDMEIFLVVFDTKATHLGEKIYPGLEAYIDHNYVMDASETEYGDVYSASMRRSEPEYDKYPSNAQAIRRRTRRNTEALQIDECCKREEAPYFEEQHERKLQERMQHMSDTYSEYLMYLIREKNMENARLKQLLLDSGIDPEPFLSK